MTAPTTATAPARRWSWRRRIGLTAAIAATVAIVGTLGWFWYASLIPSTYSVMDMGYVDTGGGPAGSHVHSSRAGGMSVANLTGPRDGPAAVAVTLTARQESFTLASGETVDGYTLNHASPGPLIRATDGDVVDVTLVNENVSGGATLHWHGVDLPNAEDGVAGVTQDAVAPGGRHTYRFRAAHPGTYWYHSHQVSHEQVRGGLFGTLVIDPRAPAAGTDAPAPATGADVAAPAGADVPAPVHTYDGRRTVDGRTGVSRVEAPAGSPARVRFVNTDDNPLRISVTGAPYRLVSLDGRDVNGPAEVTDKAVLVAAGGRADLAVTPPAGGAVRFDVGANAALVVGPPGAPDPPPRELEEALDLLSYGAPAPLGFDPAAADRRFELRIGRRPAFLDGRPGLFWTTNGGIYPDVPMYLVRTGDVVRMTISNSSGEVHPMHLHGHHAVVLSRNGVAASGSPWWTDSLDVDSGETYEVAFVADNPGIWMDHCHNLPHARDGMITHLAYEGYTTPYVVGGAADNEPE
jgi:FtsP/CotA-like multicopper oxidase with cupredoxin domain